MPVATTYPGVYVLEQPSGVVSISGVATSIALFVGMTESGPLNRPTRVLNFTSFETLFGSGTSVGELADQVRQFFLNGGAEAFILRIARNARQAQVTVDNEFGAPVFTFTAKNHGTIGDTIRIEVDYQTADPESTFNLTIYREVAGPGGAIQQVETEIHQELTADSTSPRFVTSVLDRDSNLVTAAVVGGVGLISGVAFGGIVGTGANAGLATNDLVDRLNLAADHAGVRAGQPAGVGPGRFEISVDGRAWTTVSLPATMPNADLVPVQTAINTALAPLGVAVTVTDVNLPGAGGAQSRVMRIVSNSATESSSVRLRSAAGVDDMAVEAQLGHVNGGLEFSASSIRRPKPTGIVARLGGNTLATLLDFVSELARELGNNITGMRINDGTLTDAALGGVFPAVRLFEDPPPAPVPPVARFPRSLLRVRENIQTFVDTLNAQFSAASPRRWRAFISGLRVSIQPELPGPDVGPSTAITTIGGGSFDFAVNQYFAGTTTGGFAEVANVQAYRPGGYGGALFRFANGAQAGNNGLIPQPAQYDAAYAIARRDIDIFNMMILPRCQDATPATQSDAQRGALWGPASVFCKSRRSVLFVDPPAWATPDLAASGIALMRTGVVKDHSAIYWPRVTIVDPVSGAQRQIDPAGSAAGVAARIDVSRGVWKASAGLEAAIFGVRGVERRMSDEENGIINPQAINAIRVFPNGIVIWGARTMDGFDNSGNTDYRYLPVRRTALFIEESLYRGLKFAVFEPNDEPLWAQIRLAAGAFMNGLFRQGAFQGTKASDAYLVKCDNETTTQTDINLGIVNVLVMFAPLRPAEFVVLIIKQKAGQVQT